MTTTKKPLLAQVQDEFAERYGIDPQQVTFEIRINDVSKELGVQILEDHKTRSYSDQFFVSSQGEEKLDFVRTGYGLLWVRRNDLNE